MKEKPAIEGGKPVREKFLIFGSPDIGKKEIQEVVHSLETGWLGTGPKVARFEEMVKECIGTKYALALNSCTAGLHLSLMACGVGPGDEVITTAMTFGATANVIEHTGAKPVLCDIKLPSMNIDPEQIKKKITSRTKVIMPVHMAGRPCDMDEITRLAKDHKLKIVEDAAHAFGAEYKGKKIGTIGDLTAFSFYVTKNLITGEGGMVTTDVQEYSEFIQLYALHGMSKGAWKRYSDEGYKHYLIEAPGYKYNMMDLQAAIGIHQLEDFDKHQAKRKEVWGEYNKRLANLPIQLPAEPDQDTTHAYHLYTILLDLARLDVDRDTILEALKAENVGAGVHFIAIPLHPYYKEKYGFIRGDFPNSEFVSDRTISIPFSSKLTKNDIDDVVNALSKILHYYQKH